jgi:hypothetical protein
MQVQEGPTMMDISSRMPNRQVSAVLLVPNSNTNQQPSKAALDLSRSLLSCWAAYVMHDDDAFVSSHDDAS